MTTDKRPLDVAELRKLTALDSKEVVREALRQAADEIERLRAENALLSADFEEVNDGLYRARAAINARHEDVVHDIRDMKEENEKLRSLLEKADSAFRCFRVEGECVILESTGVEFVNRLEEWRKARAEVGGA